MRNRTVTSVLGWMVAGVMAFAAAAQGQQAFQSPYDVAFSPNGALIAVSNRTAGKVLLLDKAGQIKAQAPVVKPGCLAWAADSSAVFAADYESGKVVQIAADGKVVRTLAAGPHPNGVAVAAKKNLLLVGSMAFDYVSVIDLASGQEKAKIKVVREPFWIAVSADESTALVSNLLPAGSAAEPTITAAVSVIDLGTLQKTADILLPPNTTAIRATAISPDGKWGYAVHTVGRTTLPATQLERGWVNTNALSVIDMKAKNVFATVLLDNLSEGAADPWGIAMSKDGNTMWVTLAGVHQLARIDLAGLHRNLVGQEPAADPKADPKDPKKVAKKVYSQPTIWQEIKADASKRAELVNDLSALYVANLMTRTPLPGKGPRGISLAPDGSVLAIGQYFTGDLLMVCPNESKVLSTVSLGTQPAADEARKGEQIFHDAHYSFQHWLSCATCHPNEARADGLNWDLTNDGIGNPKNARSLLYAHRTPPAMSLGIRDTMESAAMAGFRFAAFQPQDPDLKATQAFLRSIKHEKSPYLKADGSMSEKALRGKAIFNDAQTGCAMCHTGELMTDMKTHNVGTQGPLDHKEHVAFDTPALIELWRTGPFLHDGRAATLDEVLTKLNAGDKHGKTSQLNKQQIEDLVEYLLSL